MSEPLLAIDEAALAEIRRSMVEADPSASLALRISVNPYAPAPLQHSLGLERLEDATAEDIRLDFGDVPVLVSARHAGRLRGTTVTYVEGDDAAGFQFERVEKPVAFRDPIATRIQDLLTSEINVELAAHGGRVTLLEVHDGRAFIAMGGGCQGCGHAQRTLEDGISGRIKARVPEIREVVDVTNHAAGTNPYYPGARG